MIASRKVDRLQNTANELQQYLPANGPAELDFVECNIRNENQVMMIQQFISVICIFSYCLLAMITASFGT